MGSGGKARRMRMMRSAFKQRMRVWGEGRDRDLKNDEKTMTRVMEKLRKAENEKLALPLQVMPMKSGVQEQR